MELAVLCLSFSEQYLLLDEPTQGVDLEMRHVLWEAILKLRQQCGILLVTNSIDEAEQLGDRIAIFTTGAIACCGSSMYLRRQHGTF